MTVMCSVTWKSTFSIWLLPFEFYWSRHLIRNFGLSQHSVSCTFLALNVSACVYPATGSADVARCLFLYQVLHKRTASNIPVTQFTTELTSLLSSFSFTTGHQCGYAVNISPYHPLISIVTSPADFFLSFSPEVCTSFFSLQQRRTCSVDQWATYLSSVSDHLPPSLSASHQGSRTGTSTTPHRPPDRSDF